MKEILSKRTKNTKVFKKENGFLEARVYGSNIHYLKNGKYEEIKNNLIEKDKELTNEYNSYKTIINKENSSIRYEQDDSYLELIPTINKNIEYIINKNDKEYSKVTFKNVLENIDLSYEIANIKVKEEIIINKKIEIESFEYKINTNLIIELKDNELIAKNKKQTIFKFLTPFIKDSNNEYGNVNYELKDDKLIIHIDKKWINDKARKYPIIVDPTLINKDNGVDDTYIYNGDTNVTRYNRNYICAGVEKINNQNRVNRGLLKFVLPELGTGEEIVRAELCLTSYAYPEDYPRELTEEEMMQNTNKIIEVHKLTSDLNIITANWNNMSSQYSNEVESVGYVCRSYFIYNMYENEYELVPQRSLTSMLITDLVKKWYKDEPNYGIMIKQASEEYINDMYPKFFSSNCGYTDLVPELVISYRNQSGLEDYWDYSIQSFTDGSSFVNNYNGNLVAKFDLASTLGILPANIGIVYNTNDVVLNNDIGFGKGYKLTLDETIKEVIIEEKNMLEYCDGDGTTHYFYRDSEDTTKYFDEDGLSLEATKDNSTTITIKDKNGDSTRYNKNGNYYYLSKITDVDNREINITRNSSNNITKITDSSTEEINITYGNSQITIASPKETTYLNISNNILTSLVTKNGTTTFTYDSNNKLTSITDVNGMKIAYEYYNNSPYKIKKVKQYGINNVIGEYFEISYGLKTSIIEDNKGRIIKNIYNNSGNLLSRNSMTPSENIKEAYSVSSVYNEEEENTRNKLLKGIVPIRYTKNYYGPTNYTNSNSKLVLSNDMNLVNESVVFEGASAIKLVSESANQYASFNGQISSLPKTTSIYVKTTGIAKVYFYEYGTSNILYEKQINSSNDFEKIIFTGEEDNYYFKIENITACITYVGDIQIEDGYVCNDVNTIMNSDFEDGTNGWTLTATNIDSESPVSNVFEVVTIDNDGNKALKVKMNSENTSRITKEIEISGLEDDLYYLSFWYKNEGLEIEGGGEMSFMGNTVSIAFEPTEGPMEYCVPEQELTSNKESWQYFSASFAPIEDYKKIIIVFNEGRDSGNLYLTNFSLYKSLKTSEYKYDNNGNMTETIENKDTNIFNYDKNNELISGSNIRGRNFKIEYDNNHTERVLRATSSIGLSNKLTYDTYGNPTKIKVSHDYNDTFATDYYKIRSKGTHDYLNIEAGELKFREDYCSNSVYKITLANDEIKISDGITESRYFNTTNNTDLILTNNEAMFKYELNDNGSFHIYLYEEEIIPGEGSVLHHRYFKRNNNRIILEDNPENLNNYLYEFYLEKATSLFIEKDAEYSSDGRFLTSVTDTLFNKTEYQRNTVNGLLTKTIDANLNEIDYTYNSKNQVTSIAQGNKEVEYSYNSNTNLLETISQDNKEFAFTYDNYLNITTIKINNRILVTNTYESNNGNLLSSTYGNGGVISYTYDGFNRVKTITKANNKVYEYFYNNNGNISKIKENDIETIIDYDLNKRIKKYQKDEFVISNKYDIDDNLINKKYTYQSNNSEIINTYNKDGVVLSSNTDNILTTYNYDELNRISSKTTNNNITISYDYVHIGKRTSGLIKSITYGNNIYTYKYDKLYNITDIYLNTNLINHYEYDIYNELLSDTNYINDIKYEYTYNNAGNITTKVKRNRLTNVIINTDTYSYIDLTWEDLLTSYNNESITYDTIGNPLTIGTKVLTWIDGRKLNSYTDGNLSITYKYNIDGIRTEKTVNGVTTKYILEGTNIIYENRNNTILYYFYDDGGVSGIKYNNTNYFFIRNIQGDIIRIVDSNNSILVKYEYDALGNIISIKDNNDNIITDPTNIGLINPFRYRGYYYDNETNFYYLNMRYYNPLWGRFINADGIIGANKDLISHNIFVYCSNNYINNSDIIGDNALAVTGPALAGGAIGFVSQFISNELNDEEYNKDLIPATIGGAVGGVVESATGNWIIGTIVGIFVKNVIVEGIKTINKVNRKVNQNQCSMINEATLSISGLNILKNTAIESANSILIGETLRVKNVFPNGLDMQSNLYDVTTNSIDISIKYISKSHVSYKLSDNSSYTNPYFKQTRKYLVRKEKKIIETTSGLCIIEWAD